MIERTYEEIERPVKEWYVDQYGGTKAKIYVQDSNPKYINIASSLFGYDRVTSFDVEYIDDLITALKEAKVKSLRKRIS